MNWWDDVDWQDPINRDCPLNAGILGWWMGAPGLFGGTRLWDLTNLNHGTLTNMDPVSDWVNTERGPVLNFDGSNDFVVCETLNGRLTLTGEISLHALVKIGGTSFRDIVSKWGGVNNRSNYILRTVDRKPRFTYRNSANTTWHEYEATSALTAGRVSVLSFSGVFGTGSTFALYVDGVPVPASFVSGNGNDSPITTANRVFIGATQDIATPTTPAAVYDSDIHTVMVASKRHSPNEVRHIADNLRYGFPDMLNHYRRRSIFLPPAATFNPAWALRQSRIIGGGVI